ncbi:MAG: hypothetical protein CMH55_04360 [Myxococcales bacterium]|nr:hypothetical protein [Myxococcales bacterium]
MSTPLSFFAALCLLRLPYPLLLYLQELPEGPPTPLVWAIMALLLPACGHVALAVDRGRVRHQLGLEVVGLLVLLVCHPNPGLIGFCLAQVGLLMLSLRQATVMLRW